MATDAVNTPPKIQARHNAIKSSRRRQKTTVMNELRNAPVGTLAVKNVIKYLRNILEAKR